MTLDDLDDLPKAPPKEKAKAYQRPPEQEEAPPRATVNNYRGTLDESEDMDDPRQSALYYAKLKEKDYPRESIVPKGKVKEESYIEREEMRESVMPE